MYNIYPNFPELLPPEVELVINYLEDNPIYLVDRTGKVEEEQELNCKRYSQAGEDINFYSTVTVPKQIEYYLLQYESEKDRLTILKDDNFKKYREEYGISDESILLALNLIKMNTANQHLMELSERERYDLNSSEYLHDVAYSSSCPSWIATDQESKYQDFYTTYGILLLDLMDRTFEPTVKRLLTQLGNNELQIIPGLTKTDGELDETKADNLVNELNTEWTKYESLIEKYNKDLFEEIKQETEMDPNYFSDSCFIQTRQQAIITLATAFCIKKFDCSFNDAISMISSVYKKQLNAKAI